MDTNRMKKLFGLVFLFCAATVFAANPSLFIPWTAIRGTNGITTTTNPSVGVVIFDPRAFTNDAGFSNRVIQLVNANAPSGPWTNNSSVIQTIITNAVSIVALSSNQTDLGSSVYPYKTNYVIAHMVGGTIVASPSGGGVLLVTDSTGGGSGRIQFGGTSSSFASITRNGSGVTIRNGDDSSNSDITAQNFTASTGFRFTATGSRMRTSVNGRITLFNASESDFGLLQFGGTGSTYPAIKRTGTELQARLADDSGFAGLDSETVQTTLSNKLSLASIAVGASPFNYTNNQSFNAVVYIGSGTVSNIAVNGTSIATNLTMTGLSTVILQSNEWTTVTYSVAPLMTWKPF